jgi:hypothetical protein
MTFCSRSIAARTLALCLAAGAAPAIADDGRAPFLWRNSGALTALSGLPRARDALLPAAGRTSVVLAPEIASQFTQDTENGHDVVIDVETTTVLLAFEHGFSEQWAASIEIPLISHDGGFLDGLIEDYHDLLGFPDGGRESRPRDDVFVAWLDGSGPRTVFTDAESGLGDVRIAFARSLERSADRATTLRLGIELPTGDVDDLLGNEGVDLSLSGHVTDTRLLAKLGLTVHASAGLLAQLDSDELYGDDGEDLAAFGNLTLAWPVSDRWTIKGQLDGHTRLADTPLRQVGGWSVQGTLGASVRLGEGLVLEGGFAEDLRPGSAPDIAFLFALRGVL